MRKVYYLEAESRLKSGDYYQRNGVTPIILLDGAGVNLFSTQWNWENSFINIRSRAMLSAPFMVGLWADNIQQKQALAPWDDEDAWGAILGNLYAIRKLAEHDCLGVIFDSEIYTATPNNNGGLMYKSAWKGGKEARQRGQQVRETLGDLTLGTYALVSDVVSRKGWLNFWGGAFTATTGDMVLDESGYLSGTREKKAFSSEGIRNLPGRTIRGDKFRGNIPKGSFWVYPWDETNLDRHSAKWRG